MSTALGKRKERDEDGPKHGLHGYKIYFHLFHFSSLLTNRLQCRSTLFVSNLPYTATSTDLQTLFSDIAPVRSAFVVTEPGSGVSKGVEYVSFAIKEDAESSFAKIAEEGISLVGRKLRVQWAESKVLFCFIFDSNTTTHYIIQPKEPREKGDAATAKKEPKSRPPPRPHVPHDPLAIRTIIISGLPPTIDSKSCGRKSANTKGPER